MVHFGCLIIDQAINFVGLTCKVGQIQRAVLTQNHGTIQVVLAVAREFQIRQISLHKIQRSAIASVVSVDPPRPDVSGIIQQIEQLGVPGDVVFVIVQLCIAARGNGRQHARARVLTQETRDIECSGIQRHGVLGRQEEIVIDASHHGSFFCGEELAVGHIPQGDLGGIGAGVGQGLTFHGDLVHSPAILHGVHDIHHLVFGIVGGRGETGVYRCAAGPGLICLQVPLEEHGVAVLVLENAVQGRIDGFHRHHTGCRNRRIQHRSGRNHTLTYIHTGHGTLGIHSSDRLIRRSPGHIPVCCSPRQYGSAQLCLVVPQNAEVLIGKNDGGDLLSGLRPAAARRLHRNAQRSQLMSEICQGHHFTGCWVNFIQVRENKHEKSKVDVIVRIPIEFPVVGVHLQCLHIVVAMHFVGNGHWLCHGVQGEPVHEAPIGNAVGIAVSNTVEVALVIAGKGIGSNPDLTQDFDGTQKLVHSHQLIVRNAIYGFRLSIVCHIGQNHSQIGHISGLGGIFFIEDIQIAIGRGCKDHAVDIRSSQESLIALGNRLSRRQIVVSSKTDPSICLGIERNHIRCRQRLANLNVHLVGGSIHGIVSNLQQELLAVDILQVQRKALCLTRLCIRSSALEGQSSCATCIIQNGSSQIAVVAGLHRHGVTHQANRHILQNRRGVINDGRNLQGSTFTQSIPVHGAILLDIQLRRQSQGQLNGVPFLQTCGSPVQIQTIASLLPGVRTTVVEGCAHSAWLSRGQHFASCRVGHSEPGSTRIPDGCKVQFAELIAPLAVDGVPLRHILLVGNQGVAAKIVHRTGLVPISDAQGVCVDIAQIGYANFFPRGIFHAGTNIKHGAVGPVAIECQHGDGMAGALHTLQGCQCMGIDISLHIGAAGVVPIQIGLLRLGQLHGHCDLHRTIGRNRHSILAQLAEEQVHIIGIHLAVVIEIGSIGIGDGCPGARHIVQQRLAVIGIHIAIAIKIALGHFTSCVYNLAVGSPGDVGLQGSRCGIQVGGQLGHILIAVGIVNEHILGEEICGELKHLGFVCQVVEGEAKGIHTLTAGILAQLRLDLAVVLAIHQNIGIGRGGSRCVGKAGALL